MELQPGLGLGAEKFWLVFVFETPAAFNSFVTSGWEAGANAMLAAKSQNPGRRTRRSRVGVSGRVSVPAH